VVVASVVASVADGAVVAAAAALRRRPAPPPIPLRVTRGRPPLAVPPQVGARVRGAAAAAAASEPPPLQSPPPRARRPPPPPPPPPPTVSPTVSPLVPPMVRCRSAAEDAPHAVAAAAAAAVDAALGLRAPANEGGPSEAGRAAARAPQCRSAAVPQCRSAAVPRSLGPRASHLGAPTGDFRRSDPHQHALRYYVTRCPLLPPLLPPFAAAPSSLGWVIERLSLLAYLSCRWSPRPHVVWRSVCVVQR
jgi:hypothetical protein